MRGRIRTIKPEVHTDEGLWDVEQKTGMPLFRLFVGLWNFADREGRFEWRPRALKAAILPYYVGDVSAALDALVEAGFLVRYEVSGRPYGLVRTFTSHQVINQREARSELPGPVNADPVRAPAVHMHAHASASARTEAHQTKPAKSAESNESAPSPETHVQAPVAPVQAHGEGKGREWEGEGKENAYAFSTRVREGVGSGGGSDGLPEVSAAQIQTRFQALYQARFHMLPYLGGGQVVTSFADRLRGTARERGLDALDLLGQTFAEWAARPLDEIAQNAPYAAFAARFGSLCKPSGANGASELDQLHDAQIAALKAKDHDRYRSLVDEERRRNGGHK